VTRWLAETGGTRGEEYATRFAAHAAEGRDMHGEARFIMELLGRPGRVLDAGCGIGRVGEWLAAQGCSVLGVDSDPSMIEVARRQSPELPWVLGDLLTADLGGPWDVVVMTGNVIIYVEPGTEAAAVQRLSSVVAPGGRLVSGWNTARLPAETYEGWARAAGLEPEARYATWERDPWHDDAQWCVSVCRAPSA
jgi:SAM-dependent methyltransferase